MDFERALIVAKKAAILAGKETIRVRDKKILDVRIKTEKNRTSPVTEADINANALILKELAEFSDCGILTEEAADKLERLDKAHVWIIDPLDGTKEFVEGGDEFTVNIALVRKNEPVLGVIYLPKTEELYFAAKGKGAFYQKDEIIESIRVSKKNKLSLMTLVISKSHATEELKQLISKYEFAGVKSAGSSLKGCLVARGDADVYLRTGPVNEWDICAMQSILTEAGGIITDLKGKVLKYNKKNIIIESFLASNNIIHEELLSLTK